MVGLVVVWADTRATLLDVGGAARWSWAGMVCLVGCGSEVVGTAPTDTTGGDVPPALAGSRLRPIFHVAGEAARFAGFAPLDVVVR